MTSLASYTFVPWLRQGLSSEIDAVDSLGQAPGPPGRALVDLTFDLNGTPVARQTEMLGPGDILGLNPRAIIRSEPQANTTDHEPNYLAFCEFYDEDLPWRYSPASANTHRLRPWIALVVVTEGEFEPSAAEGAPLDAVRFSADLGDLFPPVQEAWAWAHVQAHVDVTDDGSHDVAAAQAELSRVLGRNPDLALGRVLCPRRLEPLTAYTALIVPAFEAGRLAGLGATATDIDAVGNQLASWAAGDPVFPVYHRWTFGTGERGDFEELVRRLEPRPVPDEVGQRDIDVTTPEFGVRGIDDPPTMALGGALRRPLAASQPPTWPPATPTPFIDDLTATLNANADRIAGRSTGDPVVGPPIYGQWHAIADTVDPVRAGWLDEVNVDPRHRAAAGVGAQVVRDDQEHLMAEAWGQLGDILEANRRIRWAQLVLAVSQRMFTRHIEPRAPADAIGFLRPVHQRIAVPAARSDGTSMTWRSQIDRSTLTAAGGSTKLRSLARPRGRIARHAGLPTTGPEGPVGSIDAVERLSAGTLAAAPARPDPTGAIRVDDGVADLGPSWIRPWMIRQQRAITAGLAVLAVVLLFVFPPLAIVAFAAAAGWIWVVRRFAPELAVRDALSEHGLTADAVERVGSRPDFVVKIGIADPPPVAEPTSGTDSPEAARFRAAVTDLHGLFEFDVPTAVVRNPVDTVGTAAHLIEAMRPTRTIPKRVRALVRLPDQFPAARPSPTIVPVMAHPVFKRPMYEPLRDASADLMIPNLHLIPDDTVSILETNRPFIESYMLGLNHEMGRELLWREFLTDQRGSYFRQFWDVLDTVRPDDVAERDWAEQLLDLQPLHEWTRSSPIGSHPNRDLPTGDDGRVVLLVRGQLLKRYPRAVIFAQRARWGPDPDTGRTVRLLDDGDAEETVLDPAFSAMIDPDVRLIGFDLTTEVVRGSADPDDDDPGWFFVIQERPGETRFGLDVPTDDTGAGPVTSWDDLSWGHVATTPGRPLELEPPPPTAIGDEPDASVAWGTDSASMAYILYQSPVMVALHAADMLSPLP